MCKISYNLRRFGELPYHLINAGRITDLCEHVLFNYHWLHAKISAVPIDQALEDFTRAISVISGYDESSGNEEILRQVLSCVYVRAMLKFRHYNTLMVTSSV